MKKIVWSILIFLGVFCAVVTYQYIIKSQAQAASIDSALDTFLTNRCNIQVDPFVPEKPIRITTSNNEDLRSLIDQLKMLEYKSITTPGIPACGEMVQLKSLCHKKDNVWISHYSGVFIFPEERTLAYSFYSRINNKTNEILFDQAMKIYQSLDEN